MHVPYLGLLAGMVDRVRVLTRRDLEVLFRYWVVEEARDVRRQPGGSGGAV